MLLPYIMPMASLGRDKGIHELACGLACLIMFMDTLAPKGAAL